MTAVRAERNPASSAQRPLRRCIRSASLALVAALAGCGAPPRGDLPSVLIVTLDTTRADHLGAYGYFRDTSPAFDALARESILFENALAPMATTLPSHVTAFTSTAPLEHGVLANVTLGGKRFVPAPGLRPIAEIAREIGMRTAAFVSAAPLKRDSGIEAGFETFDEPADRTRVGAATVDRALRWLAEQGDAPVFLWVHLYDAHWPRTAHPPYDQLFRSDAAQERWIAERRIAPSALRPLAGTRDDARSEANAYDGALRYQDGELGRLLDGLRAQGRWDATALLVLGDHGEGLCQHGEPAHGSTWNEQLHAPVLMRVPGAASRRVAEPLAFVDVMPTFLALVGASGLALPPGQASGRDALAKDALPVPIVSQDTGRERDQPYRLALTSGRWKYFRSEEPDGSVRSALYDLAADPFELEDVADQQPERVAELRGLLETRVREQLARGEALRGGRGLETRPLDPEIAEQLRALGYTGDARSHQD